MSSLSDEAERKRASAVTSPCQPSNDDDDAFSAAREGGEAEEKKKQAIPPLRLPRVAINSVDVEDTEENDDSSSPLMALTPSCVQDFTKEWVLSVMQQYYETNFNETITEIGKFHAEKADREEPEDMMQSSESSSAINSNSGSEEEQEVQHESGKKSSKHSQHILSEAYKVMVDVPDPPKNAAFKGKIHHLFVKIPPLRTAKFERMVRRNRTLEHEVKVYSELLQDLKAFVKGRVGDLVELKIPELYHSYEDGANDNQVLVIEDLAKKGFTTKDWFKQKLTHPEVMLAVEELAKFHACGLAYRMSLKEEIDDKYPYLDDDLYTSNMAKELLAKYLDSFLHFLSLLPGIQEHVLKLRKISNEVFQLLVKLRRPNDPLGTRFNTICHGDMWMGNLMFRGKSDGSNEPEECTIIDFHSAQFLSPATDLAHLLLTSTTRQYRQEHWDEVVQSYYDTFNVTLAEFGLVLRHLGTTYNDFLYEVKRALRGQFLCVAFIIPIVIYCGPTEWRFERRRGSSVDRKNTVRHLIQMMAITEEDQQSPEVLNEEDEEPSLLGGVNGGGVNKTPLEGIPVEFQDLYKDEELRETLIDLIQTAADLDILDFQEFCKHINTPKPMWSKTQATTGKHIPVY